jgi:PAS domain S-box-containing protein
LSILSAQVHQSRDLLRTLFDGLDDGMLLVSAGGAILAANQSLAALLELKPDQLVGKLWSDICMKPPIWFPGSVVVQTLYDGRPRRRRERFTTPDNHHLILDLQTLPLMNAEQTADQVILHIENVTERVQMEALVMQNERLAATGKLAATMAHEINTPLQSIRSCLYLAGKTNDSQREKYLSLAREEIDRISGILRHLLDLHRPGSGTFVPINLTDLVERVLLLTGGTMAERKVELERDLAQELPLLNGRVDQLTQVLLNLTLNAVEAMTEGGTLRFVTRALNTNNHEQSPKVVLEISDSGHGMSAETQSHIFEPFFTTKPGGTGIGLAVSQKIIAQHGGKITVRSEPSLGSTFTITFTLAGSPHGNQKDEA